jgi:heme exporter protein C
MKLGKKFDLVILILSIVFILIAIYVALIVTDLVPTDVSSVVRKPSRYDGFEMRVKGVVQDWDGNDTFVLRDVTTPVFVLNVTHKGSFPSNFDNGEAVYVKGVYSGYDPHIQSENVELAVNQDWPGGWIAPYAQKIFYFHVSAAWVSFVAFGVVLIGSIQFLRKPDRMWDTIAYSSAEVGIVFCTLAIVTGPIWGKDEWGVYWRWEDTKLTITFILWLIFIAYLILRGGAESEDKSRLAAVFGIIGFVCVPLSFISSRIWQSMHPNVVATSEGSMGSGAGMGLGLGVIAFTFLYIFIVRKRYKIQEMTYRINELKDEIGGI